MPIASVRVTGLHDARTLAVDLKPGVSLIYGKNGTGKTTLLHILANIMNGDFDRFLHLTFVRIEIETFDKTTLTLEREKSPDGSPSLFLTVVGNQIKLDRVSVGRDDSDYAGLLGSTFGGRPVYLPAFRMTLDSATESRGATRSVMQAAEKSAREVEVIATKERKHLSEDSSRQFRWAYRRRDKAEIHAIKTVMCREWFGNFLPIIRYPGLLEVEAEVREEVEAAFFAMARADEQSASQVFVDVLRVLQGKSQQGAAESDEIVIARVRENLKIVEKQTHGFSDLYRDIAQIIGEPSEVMRQNPHVATGILAVYDRALANRAAVQKAAFMTINKFISSVNKFLEDGKYLSVDSHRMEERRRAPGPTVVLPDGRKTGLSALSSGERQVVTMIYAATHMSKMDGIVLIDEPELSLHLDWQNLIIGELIEQAVGRQLIACTHSPEIGSHHSDAYVELRSWGWTPPNQQTIEFPEKLEGDLE